MRQLEYICFLNRSGYAQAAQDYIYALKSLDKYDLKISLMHSAPEQISLTPNRYVDLTKMIRKVRTPDATQFLHCIPSRQHEVTKLKNTIGFGTFETFGPPKEWVSVLNSNNAVVCPSRFTEKIFRHAGVEKPIFYVPHCFDPALFNPTVECENKSPRFTFLYFGTWKKRKGWSTLIEAWAKEFDLSDNVELLIKTDRFTLGRKAVMDLIKQLGLEKKDIAPIEFEGKVWTEAELPKFLKKADCLVSPTLGEGFGLPGLQCMALGIPVIITNFSGCTEYANNETATLLEPENFIAYTDMDAIPQFANHTWANVTVDEVRRKLRFVFENQQIAKAKAVYATSYVTERFSYRPVATLLDNMLESIS